jgi:nucleotide-binding universal stress UspA family protein
MSYKTIVVSLNNVSRAGALNAAAVDLAVRNDAHLIGLYVIPAPRIYTAMSAHTAPVVLDEEKVFFEEREAGMREAFEKASANAGVSYEWRRVDSHSSDVSNSVIEHGMQADVIIASQSDEDGGDGLEADFCERIVMESGRPVLLLPTRGEFKTIGSHVIIGWNATREAARAIFEAMPILEKSSDARLIWVDPQNEGERAGNLPGAEMAATLARHGVKATAEAMPTGGLSVGNALLNRASDLGADMIVIGAYGHSRLREFVFGGATRTLLSDMTVPVLISH